MIEKFEVLYSYRRVLAVGVALSLVLHVVVVGLYLSIGQTVSEVIHRITFEPLPPPSFFVKPPTATTKVLEFRKVPVPQGWFLQRKTQTTQAKVAEVQALAALRTDAMLDRLEVTEITPSVVRRDGGRFGLRGGGGGDTGAVTRVGFPEPSLQLVAVQGRKEAQHQVDMRLDMLSVKHMDTGQYQAMVIQDPNNRRKVKGFLHIAETYSSSKTVSDSYDVAFSKLDPLIKALEEYTGIEADYLGAIPLDDPRLLEVPWLLLKVGQYGLGDYSPSSLEITAAELVNLGRYLAGGGFALGVLPSDSGSSAVLQRKTGIFDILRRALKTQGLNEGANWRFVVLHSDHPIYHSFFDFDTSVRHNQMSQHSTSNPLPNDMGLEIGNRLAVFLTAGRDIEVSAATLGEQEGHWVKADATRALQFTVNTVVFALTQEGSVTQQLMMGTK
ncbi:MAG: DUF4159 domain-containing protein [Candidatus Latescibacteria bacterium]|nr:DUF4159 domain-containing protein [Candidatus Latescibacterota bacterium]